MAVWHRKAEREHGNPGRTVRYRTLQISYSIRNHTCVTEGSALCAKGFHSFVGGAGSNMAQELPAPGYPEPGSEEGGKKGKHRRRGSWFRHNAGTESHAYSEWSSFWERSSVATTGAGGRGAARLGHLFGLSVSAIQALAVCARVTVIHRISAAVERVLLLPLRQDPNFLA